MGENRFLIIHKEEKKNKGDSPLESRIIKDNETGALYYQATIGSSRMITPLIGPDGKYMVETVD